ncbi:hypothetical protein QBC35DRAFT_243231 [Podospora australis]|uniref:Letm1 RBD domain-containing protein n=1 Tax=Podospora australis TaxID=1536484 RepID=A0AAN6X187_9PEZI|nr:hypothetical protein QBC35DRAFT_243231 [Podospora australis]
MRQPIPHSALRAHSLSITKLPPTTPLHIQRRRLYSSESLTTTATRTPPPTTRANPPHTTRPPPLDLPIRQPDTSTIKHWFNTGKAYMTFYKTGLKNIFVNRRLVHGTPSSPSEAALLPQGGDSRAYSQLYLRYKHDIRLLPLFGLLLLVCEEFTPLVILLVPRIAPYTCRLPKQVDLLLRQDEQARTRLRSKSHISSLGEFHPGSENRWRTTQGRILGVLPQRIPLPKFIVTPIVERRMAYIRHEDQLLVSAGGADALNEEELRLACSFRGINILHRGTEQEIRDVLRKWLRLSVETKPPPGLAPSFQHFEVSQEEEADQDVDAEANAKEALAKMVTDCMVLCEDDGEWETKVQTTLKSVDENLRALRALKGDMDRGLDHRGD